MGTDDQKAPFTGLTQPGCESQSQKIEALILFPTQTSLTLPGLRWMAQFHTRKGSKWLSQLGIYALMIPLALRFVLDSRNTTYLSC